MSNEEHDDYGEEEPYLERGTDFSLMPLFLLLGVALLVAAGIGAVFFRFQSAGNPRLGNEVAAIGALKTISVAQSLHREGDKDRDGTLDYAANLQELGQSALIDSILASGTKQGYAFELYNGPQSEFEWFAIADPLVPGETGLRFFYVDQSGVIYYSTKGPIQGPLDPNALPLGVLPLGR